MGDRDSDSDRPKKADLNPKPVDSSDPKANGNAREQHPAPGVAGAASLAEVLNSLDASDLQDLPPPPHCFCRRCGSSFRKTEAYEKHLTAVKKCKPNPYKASQNILLEEMWKAKTGFKDKKVSESTKLEDLPKSNPDGSESERTCSDASSDESDCDKSPSLKEAALQLGKIAEKFARRSKAASVSDPSSMTKQRTRSSAVTARRSSRRPKVSGTISKTDKSHDKHESSAEDSSDENEDDVHGLFTKLANKAEKFGSFERWWQHQRFEGKRNEMEGLTLCLIADSFIQSNQLVLTRILASRLIALQKRDKGEVTGVYFERLAAGEKEDDFDDRWEKAAVAHATTAEKLSRFASNASNRKRNGGRADKQDGYAKFGTGIGKRGDTAGSGNGGKQRFMGFQKSISQQFAEFLRAQKGIKHSSPKGEEKDK